MWKYTEKKRQRLETLCSSYGPTAYEVGVQKVVAERFRNMGIPCSGDAIGNLYASINDNADFCIGIAAHCDEVGIQVTEIIEKGLLRFRKIGGVRATSLIGHKVVILTEKGPVRGIVGSDPLQNNGTDNGILVKTSDLWIDIGADTKHDCEGIVEIGDYGVFEADFLELGENRIASKSLDDRLGVFIMEEVMEILRNEHLNIGVVAISTVQEEISYRGAAASVKPMAAAIVLDVDFATDIPTEHTNMGALYLGGGIGINRNADSNVVLQKIFLDMAYEKDIPVQKTVSRNISGGTDATQLQVKGNIATLNINIPLRYMHSHKEVCDKRDIEYAVRSVVGLIKRINDNEQLRNFVPWQQIVVSGL